MKNFKTLFSELYLKYTKEISKQHVTIYKYQNLINNKTVLLSLCMRQQARRVFQWAKFKKEEGQWRLLV